jgi:hypothetical protein
MRRAFHRARLLSASIVTLFAAASCGGGTEPTPQDIRAFITGVTTANLGATAAFHAGAAPAAGQGPVANVTGTSSMILGGGAFRTVTSGTAFTRIIVAIDGIDGYWELTLANAVTLQDIILTLAQTIPQSQSTFTVEYAAGTSAAIGSFDTETVSILQVGTGDIQVSVAWDAESDVDLHVIEPGGEEIYYFNLSSASGGVLDLDSNAGCIIDGVKNENIAWPSSAPPSGTYTVRVDYFDACGVTATNYVVTVRRKGQNPVSFSGQFTGLGDHGGAGAGTTITTFTY